jgi:hypothetical protein
VYFVQNWNFLKRDLEKGEYEYVNPGFQYAGSGGEVHDAKRA